MSDIIFEPVPDVVLKPGKRLPGDLWNGRIAAMKARPGEWARVLVANTPGSIHSQARNALRVRGEAPELWERMGRTVDGRAVLYMRYIGGAA